MDAIPILAGLCVLAFALYQGLSEVATALSLLCLAKIEARLPDPINVEHRNSHGPSA